MSSSKLRAITTVYSYYFPEVRSLISDLVRDYPHHVFLQSVDPGLDDFHQPILDRLVGFHKTAVPDLHLFGHRYPTAGSEEGIREYLSLLARRGVTRIYMWEGDYEGYREVARSRGIETREVPFGAEPGLLEPGHWFLSNPSARDGNIIPDSAIGAICEAGHRVFYDLSYLGSTPPHRFDVSHPNVEVAAISFSKPYGLFYYRIGFIFSRVEIPALFANKWFKNILSLLIADRLMERLDPRHLPDKYRPIQQQIVDDIRKEHGLPIQPSHALLLAHIEPGAELSAEQRTAIERFRRGEGHRFCLTPYYLSPEPPA